MEYKKEIQTGIPMKDEELQNVTGGTGLSSCIWPDILELKCSNCQNCVIANKIENKGDYAVYRVNCRCGFKQDVSFDGSRVDMRPIA